MMVDGLTIFADLSAEERARTALVTDAFSWSFEELSGRAAAMAGRFAEKGIVAGERVAFVAAGSPEVFVAIHALAGMGVTLVPVHPRLTAAEARVVIDVARADHVLDPGDLELPTGVATGPAFVNRAVNEGAPFAIVSTSGTTGRPKGAVLSRRAFLASAEASARNLGWREDDRWLLNMPLAHVGGLSVLARCLAARRAVVLLPRFDAGGVLEAIERHGVTLMSVVATMLRALLDKGGPRGESVLRRPRAILVGGAATPPVLLDACAELRVAALTTYGLTEACSQVTTQAPRDPSIRLGGSGAALAGFDLRIAGDDGAALPDGSTGRILIRGPALFDGYLAAGGALDAARGAEDFFDTGDLGELDERGQLHVHARRTDLVVTGGENVYPTEVEQALERIPGVRRALVIGVPDERWGQVVAAVIERDERHPLSFGVLSEQLSKTLAGHKKPRKWAFVEHLPLTPSGKVDRREGLSRYVSIVRDLAS